MRSLKKVKCLLVYKCVTCGFIEPARKEVCSVCSGKGIIKKYVVESDLPIFLLKNKETLRRKLEGLKGRMEEQSLFSDLHVMFRQDGYTYFIVRYKEEDLLFDKIMDDGVDRTILLSKIFGEVKEVDYTRIFPDQKTYKIKCSIKNLKYKIVSYFLGEDSRGALINFPIKCKIGNEILYHISIAPKLLGLLQLKIMQGKRLASLEKDLLNLMNMCFATQKFEKDVERLMSCCEAVLDPEKFYEWIWARGKHYLEEKKLKEANKDV